MASKCRHPRLANSNIVPSLLSQPGLENDSSLVDRSVQARENVSHPVRNIIADIQNVGGSAHTEAVVLKGTLNGRVDGVLNILPCELASKPVKVRLTLQKAWDANSSTKSLDPSLYISEDLKTEVIMAPNSNKSENRDAELQKYSLLNEKFIGLSEYMYVFGRDQIFELGLGHMKPSDHLSGRIYSDYEKVKAEDIKRNLILANFLKPILTVMPNLDHRLKDWAECMNAEKFHIINGQHTWHTALDSLKDSLL